MGLNNLEDIRHNILSEIRDRMQEELVPADLTERDENGVETLTVVLEEASVEGYDATAEFFFLPYNEGEDLQQFTSLITIDDDLYEKTIQELSVAVSGINCYLPSEGFAIDFLAKKLIYKHTYIMPAGLDKDDLMESAELAMSTALQTVGAYGYMLAEVNDDKRTAESVIKLFSQINSGK